MPTLKVVQIHTLFSYPMLPFVAIFMFVRRLFVTT